MAQVKSVQGQTEDHKLEWKKGLCGICPAGCWVEVGLNNGRLVDIRPDTSNTLGMICRRGRHAPDIVYSEHRLKYPMKRVGAKGSYDFERITWDEAYNIIVENLTGLRLNRGLKRWLYIPAAGLRSYHCVICFNPGEL